MKRIITFFILSFVLLLSCGEKRDFKNPVDSQYKLDAPQQVKAEQEGEWIKLSWEKDNDIRSGYKIERKTEDKAFRQIANLKTTEQLYFIDTTITTEVQYTCRIRGYSDKNHSPYSEPVRFTAQFPAPTHFKATPINDQVMRLTWKDNCDFEKGFILERKEAQGAFVEIKRLKANKKTTVNDSGLTYSENYKYRIKAFIAKNQSRYSNEVAINPAQKTTPTNLQLTEQIKEFDLTWTDNCAFEDGFWIERSDNYGAWQQIADLEANNTEYTDSGLYHSMIYRYRIFALVSGKHTAYSNEAVGIPKSFVKTILVDGGTFTMGDTWGDGASDETPTHDVTVHSFYMGKYEVTNAQVVAVYNWDLNQEEIIMDYRTVQNKEGYPREFMDLDDEDSQIKHSRGQLIVERGKKNCPCIEISWYGAVAFCNYLSEIKGFQKIYNLSGWSWSCNWDANGYRLPTEAEWEFAARGGNLSNGYKYSGSNTPDDVAWYHSNSGLQNHNVGTKQGNELGIYDMSGNAFEWCWDWYSSDYYSVNLSSNPRGPLSGNSRVLRGGSWLVYGSHCRVAFRSRFQPSGTEAYYGFRIVRKE